MTISFALLIPCLVAFAEPAPPEPEVTVEFLRDVLRSQLESVRSLSVVYSRSSKAKVPRAQDWGPDEHELHVDGKRISLLTDQHDGDIPPYRTIFDGHNTYEVSNSNAPIPTIAVFAEPPRDLATIAQPFDAIGGRVLLAGLPLAKMMEDPSCTLNGIVDLDDRQCWSVSLRGVDNRARSPILIDAWFDPSHDFLPSRITIHREGKTPDEFEWSWVVVEFEKLPQTSGLRWFPVLSEFHQLSCVHTMQVSHFEINPQLSDSTFAPNASVARVTDLRDRSKPKVFVTSDSTSVNERMKQIAHAARQPASLPSSIHSSQLSAAPEQSQVWFRALLGGSFACLVAGVFLWYRAR